MLFRYFFPFRWNKYNEIRCLIYTERRAIMKKKLVDFWSKLTLASKIVFIVWTIAAASLLSKADQKYTDSQVLAIWIAGCIMYAGIAQKLSKWYREKHPKKNVSTVNTASANTSTVNPISTFRGCTNDQNSDFANSPSVPCYDTMEGHDFEFFCAKLLRLNGYQNVDVTRGSGDQGIDILAEKDDIKYGIQCKCYSSDIGNKAVQEAFSGKSYYGCHVAVVLTNRHFTRSARDLADSNHVLLWDREKLEELIQKADV